MATISVRARLPDGGPAFGQGQANYLTDIDAVAQIIDDTLNLFLGTWWENANIGVPMFQQILGGQAQGDVIPLLLQQQILSVPYVNSVTNISATYITATRSYSYSCTANTSFGAVTVTGNTGSGAYLGT